MWRCGCDGKCEVVGVIRYLLSHTTTAVCKRQSRSIIPALSERIIFPRRLTHYTA